MRQSLTAVRYTRGMTTYPEKAIVWGDVETTGLVAHREQLLEIALIVTDLDLVELAEPFTATIYHGQLTPVLRSRADPFVREMHDRTGLWDRVADVGQSLYIEDAARGAFEYIERLVPEPRTARLAGNSVRLDLNFLDEHMPVVAGHLHYRMLDVSSWTGPAQWWAGVEPYPKARGHRALDDIRESIAEMRYLREQLGLVR